MTKKKESEGVVLNFEKRPLLTSLIVVAAIVVAFTWVAGVLSMINCDHSKHCVDPQQLDRAHN